MNLKPLFRRRSRRRAARQIAALRAKTTGAGQQLADTDAMLTGRRERKSS